MNGISILALMFLCCLGVVLGIMGIVWLGLYVNDHFGLVPFMAYWGLLMSLVLTWGIYISAPHVPF